MTTHRNPAPFLAVLVLLAGGCAVTGEGTTQPTRFYVLRTLDVTAGHTEAAPGKEDLSVAVSPVQLAAYLKRPHIVTLSEGNEVRLADFDRWAEPLEEGINRVLSENLSLLLGTNRVIAHGPRSLAQPRYTVAVKVTRLDGRLGGEVLLSARWGLIDRTSDKILMTRRSTYRHAVEGGGYGGLVAAENRALEELCREIAAAVDELVGG
jgi:uncharacterized lipoprotein YmbA